MKKISRAHARARGLVRYFTGKPCKRGHVVQRHVSTGHCVECHRAYSMAWYRANSEKGRATSAAWYRANSEKHRASVAVWRRRNPERDAALSGVRLARQRAAR